MSDEERDALIGRIVRENQAAVRDLACHRAKLRRVSKALRGAADVLATLAKGKPSNDPKLEDYPSAEVLTELLDEYRTVHKRVSESNDELRSVGVTTIGFES